MRYICALISGLLFTFALDACTSEESKSKEGGGKNNPVTIKIPETLREEVDFKRFIDEVTLIPLETREESLFSEAFDIIYQHNRYYIYDRRAQELFVFDSKGKYLFRLNKKGRGPQEYSEMNDFEIASNGDIHILSMKEILVYDSIRKFKKRIKEMLPENYVSHATQFAFSANGGYYLFSGSIGITKKTPHQYACYQLDGDGVFTGKVYLPVTTTMYTGGPRFYKVDESNNYAMTPIRGNDTIYRFFEDKVFPGYYLDYGKRKLPSDYLTEFDSHLKLGEAFQETSYVIETILVVESSDFLYFTYLSQSNHWDAFASKKGNVVYFKKTSSQGPGSFNYFPHIAAASQKENTFIGTITQQRLIKAKQSGIFKEKYGYLKNYPELEKIIDSLDENDNPVIMTISLKDF